MTAASSSAKRTCEPPLAEYQKHYNTAQPHQGISQRIPDSARHPPRVIAGDFRIRQIRRKPGLSGLINEYERAA